MSDPFFAQDFGPDFPVNQQNNTKKTSKHTKETQEDKKQKVRVMFNDHGVVEIDLFFDCKQHKTSYNNLELNG